MTIGAVVLLAAGAGTEGWPALPGQALAIIAWLAIINTAVAFTMWNFSLHHLTAGESSVANNAMLPQIGLLGWVRLGEAPGPWQWAGMLLVSAGVVIGQHRHRPAAHAAGDLRNTPSVPVLRCVSSSRRCGRWATGHRTIHALQACEIAG